MEQSTEFPLYQSDIEAANFLNHKPQTLRNWRSKHVGPPYIKLGRSVRYKTADLIAWMDQHRVDPEEVN
jgi:hypothetical protein